MATTFLKMYKNSYPIPPPFDHNYNYNYRDSFQYNPRSLLTKNPRYNKLYAAYFARSMTSRRRASSRIRKMSSPAASTSSASSSSSSSSNPRSKTSVSPPPAKSSNSPAPAKIAASSSPTTTSAPLSENSSISPTEKASTSSPPVTASIPHLSAKTPDSVPTAKSGTISSVKPTPRTETSVSPPPPKSSAPSPSTTSSVSPLSTKEFDNTPPSSVSPASPKLHLPSPPSAVSVPSNSRVSSSSSSAVSAPNRAVSLPPSSVPFLSSKPSATSTNTSPFKLNPPNKALSETDSKKIKIKFVDPSKFRSGVKDEKITTPCGSPKRSRPDDVDEESASKFKSPKKRQISDKASKVPGPSKEELEKVRSESLKKRRILASEVRKDSTRMHSAAQRGLANVTGNSCYRSSLFQGLFHLPKFFNFLIDQHPAETCTVPRRDCLACSLNLLSSKYWTVGVPTKEITAILRRFESQCERLGWNPGPSGQGDPHEQITWLLEKIGEQIQASSVASMQSIMQLVLSSRITCDNCHNVSVGDLQDELALSIPLKPRIRDGTLSSYLQKYVDEKIEGYKCEKCKVTGDVHRVQLISHAPDILFVQLKRFGYDGRKDKLALPIDHTLDLSPYRDPSGSTDSMEYELVASVSHFGSLDYGHYTCDARGPDGRWNCFNDNIRDATTLTKALKGAQPYLLFYQRKQT